MEQLAIKGHAIRGKEVIEILKMLGGKNVNEIKGCGTESSYYIDKKGIIDFSLFNTKTSKEGWVILTLEDFLEKFPYRVGDKVRVAEYESEVFIEDMRWNGNEIQYEVFTDETEWYSAEELNNYNQPQTMSIPETMKQITDIAEKLIKIDIPKGYEFAGIDDDSQQVVFEKVGCQYPKTYEECRNIIVESGGCDAGPIVLSAEVLANVIAFCKLIVARNAYWKIAGDWKPDWKTDEDGYNTVKFCIKNFGGEIRRIDTSESNTILAFPTEEMRDAFYENFKELINECKELL